MKTILSFQDESHRIQLVECDSVGSMKKYVIYDNRKVVDTFIDHYAARRRFCIFVGQIILQTDIMFPN